MAVKTTNKYGKITINDNTIAAVASQTASECYGVAQLVSRRLTDSLIELFNKQALAKGVKIETIKNKINIDLFIVLKEGVNSEAIVEAVKNTVKYQVENFTGMRVDNVNAYIVGVKI